MSLAPAVDSFCIFAKPDAMSVRPADVSSCPRISQNMLLAVPTAVIPDPFFVQRCTPRFESIDFSHDGSFSTIQRGILLLPCIILPVRSVNLLLLLGF